MFSHLEQKYGVVTEVGKGQTSVDIDIVSDSFSSADDTSLSARFVWLVGNGTKIRIKWGAVPLSEADGTVRMSPSKVISECTRPHTRAHMRVYNPNLLFSPEGFCFVLLEYWRP